MSGFSYKSIEEYEKLVGFKVSEAFRIGWNMGRTTDAQLGLGEIDAANKRVAELEAALATIESEVFELPCQSCGLSSECSAHDLISRIEAAIKRAKGGAK